MGFCKEFNAKTPGGDMIIPVVITAYSDRSFSFILRTPPASVLLKKAAGLPTSKKPGAGLEGAEQDEGGQGDQGAGRELAELKMQRHELRELEAAIRTFAGRPARWASTSRSDAQTRREPALAEVA